MRYHRRSIRLKDYDYASDGWYFVTICVQDRHELFGKIVGATRGSPSRMISNKYGKIIENIWQTLPDHHPIKLDIFQIMPNHIHFIIVLEEGGSRPAPTLGTIIGLFKSECTKRMRQTIQYLNQIVWQRNYYEHIIRNQKSLNRIRNYIRNNPQNWEFDRNNPKNFQK